LRLSVFWPLYCLSFDHCIVCLLTIVLSVFWPLYCLSFDHCIVCLMTIVLSVLWPLYCLSFDHCIMIKRQTIQWSKDRQHNGQKTDNTMVTRQTTQWSKDRQYNGQQKTHDHHGKFLFPMKENTLKNVLWNCMPKMICRIVVQSLWEVFYPRNRTGTEDTKTVIRNHRTDKTMTKRQTIQWSKDRQYNDQKTDNTMVKRQTTQWSKDRQYNGHDL
jgi:hypothetical protein